LAYSTTQISQYRKNAVGGASPIQLIIMLYDGSLRHMQAAKNAMEQGDLFQQNKSAQAAQRILAELMSSLDMEKGGDVSKNLLSIYSFVYNRLIEANMQDKPEWIDDCMKLMSDLGESWRLIQRQQTDGVATPEYAEAA
jgi:flagellar protein FliS